MSDIDFKPSLPPRPNSIYVSWRLHKALGLVARKTGTGREDVVETVLNEFVTSKHPEITAWLNRREDEENEFLKTLKPIPFQ